MRRFFGSRFGFLSIIVGLFIVFLPVSFSYASPGCCSHHGGVAGCNRSNDRQLCKDGSTSPTCPCPGTSGTSTSWWGTKPSTTTTKPTTTTTKPSTTTTKPKTTTTKPKATTTKPTTTTTTQSTTTDKQGCCSRHGGVVGCKGGFALCKDKSVSTTCKC